MDIWNPGCTCCCHTSVMNPVPAMPSVIPVQNQHMSASLAVRMSQRNPVQSVSKRNTNSNSHNGVFRQPGPSTSSSAGQMSHHNRQKHVCGRCGGDSTVGKSALCQVFHSDGSHFPKNYTMTCGVELMVKSVNIPETKDSVEIYLYDSAGKETFSDQVKKFWDHPSMVMIVYDVTNETSFNNSRKWLERVRAQKPEVRYPGVLVANKIDLEQRRVVSPKDGRDLAESCHLEYFECSAKELQNVDAIFSYLASEFYRLYHERQDYIEALTL